MKAKEPKWEFRARFRRNSFGWKSQPAIKRIKEAVSEIKKVGRKDRLLAAAGAVLLIEKLSPALERIDSSSGAIGTAVNNALDVLVPLITGAPADVKTRDAWLERLWDAYQEDAMPYIEQLGDSWGELCATKEVASRWADRLLGPCKMVWDPSSDQRGFFKGTTVCLSALLAAERHDELLALLEMAPYKIWDYREYGVRALAAMGQTTEALRYAEAERGINDSPVAMARTCEQVLLSSGEVDEAYERFGIEANRAGTYLAWFRSVAKAYPRRGPGTILSDLVAATPGEEGKWFAAAKSAQLFDEAIELARRTPCSPQTLTRAARDFKEKNPAFAIEAGMAALRWLVEGYGYEITGADVQAAFEHTMAAGENAGVAQTTEQRVQSLVSTEYFADGFATRILRRLLDLS